MFSYKCPSLSGTATRDVPHPRSGPWLQIASELIQPIARAIEPLLPTMKTVRRPVSGSTSPAPPASMITPCPRRILPCLHPVRTITGWIESQPVDNHGSGPGLLALAGKKVDIGHGWPSDLDHDYESPKEYHGRKISQHTDLCFASDGRGDGGWKGIRVRERGQPTDTCWNGSPLSYPLSPCSSFASIIHPPSLH